MSLSTIAGTALDIELCRVVTDTPANQFSCGSLKYLVSLLDLSAAEQTQVTQLLNTPLDTLFDQLWSKSQSTVQTMLQNAVSGSYNVTATLPATGTLSAGVGGLESVLLALLPAGVSGSQLTLIFSVTGCSATYSQRTGGIFGEWADPAYALTFDLAIEIDVAVPTASVQPLVVYMTYDVSGIKGSLGASLGGIFSGLIYLENTIWDFLTGQPTSGGSIPDLTGVLTFPELGQLFTQLSSGFANAASQGFVQLEVKISTPAAGNTAEFELTHPFDPPPVVGNASSPSVPNLIGAKITSPGSQVNAGGSLWVNGFNFPPAQSTAITIGWSDTTSGNVTQSEVQWGQVLLPPNPLFTEAPASPNDVLISRRGRYDNMNTFKATPLTPNSFYAFRVRDYDCDSTVATQWSAWSIFGTTLTDAVQLVLNYENTNVGTGMLQPDGTFSTPINIPVDVPQGTYQLTAIFSGQEMAYESITVVPQGEAVSAQLQIVNADGTAYIGTPSIWPPGAALQGSNFNQGTVALYIDTEIAIVGTATAMGENGQAIFSVAPIPWPTGLPTGFHTIIAQQGALNATATLYATVEPAAPR